MLKYNFLLLILSCPLILTPFETLISRMLGEIPRGRTSRIHRIPRLDSESEFKISRRNRSREKHSGKYLPSRHLRTNSTWSKTDEYGFGDGQREHKWRFPSANEGLGFQWVPSLPVAAVISLTEAYTSPSNRYFNHLPLIFYIQAFTWLRILKILPLLDRQFKMKAHSWFFEKS